MPDHAKKYAEQSRGVDPTPCNCLALRQAARHISQLYDQHLAEVGLRTTQYSILAKLGRLGAMPISKLAATMVMERTALSRAIGPLERDGLVKVGAGPDGRTRSVKLHPDRPGPSQRPPQRTGGERKRISK